MEKILIIDDDEGLNHFLSRFFTRKGYDVKVCLDGEEAVEKIADETFDLILLDYKMPMLNGLDTLRKIKDAHIKTPVIIMTAYGNTDTAIEAMKRGAYDYLNKPFERKELSSIVSDALELNRQMKEIVYLPGPDSQIDPYSSKGSLKIIGHSRKMQEIYKIIGQIAEKDVSVLIEGESGTGKEMVARAIYHHSRRKDKHFMAINCAAIPEHLFESELFGYERGAFTGAERTRIGKIERCDGGTCFLDEIADMAMPLQAKLLRVLQEGEFERVGGKETLKADVRVIAATNKNLAMEVKSGRFREDLFWRLKVITINIPALRSRAEDIPELVDYFVARFGNEYSRPIHHVSEKVRNLLQTYSWPGNVRELENCIRRAVILCAGDIITEDHIELQDDQNEHPVQEINCEQLMNRLKEKIETILPEILRFSDQGIHANIIEMVEKTVIIKALEECDNNQVKAARMLGISRNTLRHRLKKYIEE
ncbi:MAG: sigma-54-dependent Fis family transcriptional regulator [Deltaproteobacteria bacterium]|nr:sigma-54-dependent Fis family transcriptional regulator [Deltaproteobacteria bacterium]